MANNNDDSNNTNDNDNNGSTMSRPHKRVRVSQACEPCRLRKGKCDGRQPICDVCKGLKIDCSYDQNPKKRGLRPGQYSSLERRALLAELIAAYLIGKMPAAEESVRSFFCSSEPDLSFLSVKSKQAELDELLNRWRKRPVSRWLRETASRTDPALDHLSKFRTGLDTGPAPPDAEDPLALDRDDGENSAVLDFQTLDFQDISKSVPASETPDRPTHGVAELSVDIEMRPGGPPQDDGLMLLPSNMDQLFDVYFAYTHTWLPFIDKFKVSAVAHNSSSTLQSASNTSSLQSANLALIWAMVAYTSPRMPENSRISYTTGRKMTPMGAAKLSLSLLPACDTDMQQEYIQALVLLSLFHFEYGSQRVSWILIGLAGRVAVDLSSIKPGQHLSSSSRRTALACFVVESIIAVVLGRRPQLLTPRNLEIRQIVGFPDATAFELEAEGWEEWSGWDMPGYKGSSNDPSAQLRKEPFRILSTFNEMVLLVELLNFAATRSDLLKGPPLQGTPQPATGNAPSELSAWIHHICEVNPSLHPENLKNEMSSHAINFHCVYWIVCYLSCPQSNSNDENKLDRQIPRQLVSVVNDLVAKYSSMYPLNTAPLGLTASVTIALRFVNKYDPLHETLSQALSSIKNGRNLSMGLNERSLSRQVIEKGSTQTNDISGGQTRKQQKV